MKKKHNNIYGVIFLLLALFSCQQDERLPSGVRVTDSFNRTVSLDKIPRRIVSLAPNLTELVFYLGCGDRLAGRTDYCQYPEEAKSVPSVGTITNPDMERILAAKPDLVLASTHFQKETLDKLTRYHLKVYCGQVNDRYEDYYQMVQNVSRLLAREAQGEELVLNMKTFLSSTENESGLIPHKPQVYYMISFGDSGDFTAGQGTFIDYLISIAGGQNIAGDVKGWAYSLEKLVEKDPDIIICSRQRRIKNQLKTAAVYNQLKAVRSGMVFAIETDMLDCIGPRNIEGVRQLKKLFIQVSKGREF